MNVVPSLAAYASLMEKKYRRGARVFELPVAAVERRAGDHAPRVRCTVAVHHRVQHHKVVRARGVCAALELRDKEPQEPPHSPGLAAHLGGNTRGGR